MGVEPQAPEQKSGLSPRTFQQGTEQAERTYRAKGDKVMNFYTDFSPLIDTGLMVALAMIVWAAYRELRSRAGHES